MIGKNYSNHPIIMIKKCLIIIIAISIIIFFHITAVIGSVDATQN
jgi:hypothetical protein